MHQNAFVSRAPPGATLELGAPRPHSGISAKLHYTDNGYEHRLRTPPTDELTTTLHNKFTTNGQKFATFQHLDMSRCWALALRCGKCVVELL